MFRKAFGSVSLVLAIAGVLIIGDGAWYLIHRSSTDQAGTAPGIATTTPLASTTEVPTTPPRVSFDVKTWKTYHSDAYGFSFKYPPQANLVGRQEGDTYSPETNYVVGVQGPLYARSFVIVEDTNDRRWMRDKNGSVFLQSYMDGGFPTFQKAACTGPLPGNPPGIVGASTAWGEDTTLWHTVFLFTNNQKGFAIGWVDAATCEYPGQESDPNSAEKVTTCKNEQQDGQKLRNAILATFAFDPPVRTLPFTCHQ